MKTVHMLKKYGKYPKQKTLTSIMTCMFKVIHFLSISGLAWQACLKKAEVKLELLTDNEILMMVEKGIRGRMCQAVYRYAKANNKDINDYDKDIESS